MLLFRIAAFHWWCRIQPNHHEGEEPPDDRPESGNPHPSTANTPAAWPLIVGEMADGDFMFLFNVGDEWSLVVDAEGEDAMLVRKGEGGSVNGRVLGSIHGLQVKTVERG